MADSIEIERKTVETLDIHERDARTPEKYRETEGKSPRTEGSQ